MGKLRLAMLDVPEDTPLGDSHSPIYRNADRKAMEGDGHASEGLLSKYVCLQVDKCTHNLAFTCNKHAAGFILGDLQRGGLQNPTFTPGV